MKTVQNQFPSIAQPYKIALIGEAPGEEECEVGRPFVGTSGRFLNWQLSKCGILREACFVGNVCQVRPPGNKIEAFNWNGPEIQDGLHQLSDDLYNYQPNLCVLLGNTPLHAAKREKVSVENWRGSLFQGYFDGDNHIMSLKCLPTIHPAACLREYSYTPLLNFDLRKARQEGLTPTLELPQRNLETNLTLEEVLCRLEKIKKDKPLISVDIEGGINTMSCLSIATAANESFIVSFHQLGQSSPQSESLLWLTLADVLGDPQIPKVLQNSLYDLFVLQYSYNIPVRGVVDDTMVKSWELYCELPKSLGFQCSIYTKEPFYKDDRAATDTKTFHEYCCRDSAVTYEINDVLSKQLTGDPLTHYKLNLALLEPLLYMELKGINYDTKKAAERTKELQEKANKLQWALNELSGRSASFKTYFEQAADSFCFKKDRHSVKDYKDLVRHSKTTSLHLASEAETIFAAGQSSIESLGRLSVLTETGLNVESNKQLVEYLYNQLKLPIQYKKLKGRLTDKPTADVLALLTLYKKTNDPILQLILTIRALRTRCQTLQASTDLDGRIRCAYNIVGTETGRLSCYESPTGSGFNLQTVTKKDRDLFLPDPGFYIFQCDLSGADGWTVAAWCAALGDKTMLEDYTFGLKPAKILSLIAEKGSEVLQWSREKIKKESEGINQDDWMYFARKRVQHGSSYGMKGRTMSDQILKDSYKLFGEAVYISPSQCDHEQEFFFRRYPGILLWHKHIKHQLQTKGYLISANGHKRIFFGRLDDYDTFKQACADEPQNNTTYATNLAMFKLWTDPENSSRLCDNFSTTRLGPSVQLRIEPLHQVHDALIGQFKINDTTWALSKIHSYFANPIKIAGQLITIPFEGAYGESWGSLKVGKI